MENRERIEEINIEEDDEIEIVWDGTRRERRKKYGWQKEGSGKRG